MYFNASLLLCLAGLDGVCHSLLILILVVLLKDFDLSDNTLQSDNFVRDSSEAFLRQIRDFGVDFLVEKYGRIRLLF